MEVKLYREDLKPQYESVNCSQTKFHMFDSVTQEVIRLAGRAVFYEYDGRNYNAIFENMQ